VRSGADAASGKEVERLLAEQIAYYRALAPEYEQHAIDLPGAQALISALDAFRPVGRVLELACGPGSWTAQLQRHADCVTAVDASPEMLAAAARRTAGGAVRYLQVDIFDWQPDRRYDVVFFGFWLSHVPPERFEAFWTLVRDCLAPGGRVFFLDDSHRTPDENIPGQRTTIQRRLSDGRAYRAIKVVHRPDELERRIRGLGWDIQVHCAGGPLFWGAGTPEIPATTSRVGSRR
jgi:SAM-dependent methyltransferase